MTAPQDPYRPTGDGATGGPASDPGPGGPGGDTPGGAPAGFPTPPGAGTGAGYGAPTAFGAPAGYGAPSAYGAPGYGPPAGQAFGSPGTPQLASWGRRVGAALIDAAIVLGIILVAVLVGALLSSVSDALGGLVLALGYVAGLGFYFWQLYVQGQTGQTIGKKKVGLRLLGEQDGRPIGPGLSIARYFVHVVDSIPCYVGYLWPLWDAKRQTFADKILKTVVVEV